MKLRTTLILLVIAAGLYVYMRFYESKQPTTQEAEDINSHVVQMDRDKVDGITITNNETKIELQKVNSQWQMLEPVKDRADDSVVAQLLTDVETLDKDTSLAPEKGKDEVRDLGLEKPNVSLELHGTDAPPAILFGKDTAIEGKEYVRLANSKEVYVVPNELRSQVAKPADDFRNHGLADMAATQVETVDVKTPAGEIELQKDHDHWGIDKPIKARGDDEKISDLIAQTLNTRVDSFVPADQEAAANTALSDAQGTVTFTAEGIEKPLVFQFSKPLDKDPQKIYAKLSTRDLPVVLSSSAGAILAARPNDVRDHHLIRLNLDTVDRIHIQPAGAPEVLLARKAENWSIKSLNDKAANAGEVQRMVSVLTNQQVTAFVSDVATELPKYGLDQPKLKLVFSSFASENTAETKAGEEPLETVLFGNVDGDNVYAKLDDEPFIVSVPKGVLDPIHTDSLKWQDLAVYNVNPDQITGLDVTRQGQATISMVKEKGQWKPAKGDITLDLANVQGIASTLSTLRAEEWVGATKPDQGLETPAVTITFTMADKSSNTVKIGGPLGDNWYAGATGADGTFLITKPEYELLTADVLPVAAPKGTPAAEATPGAGGAVMTPPVEAK